MDILDTMGLLLLPIETEMILLSVMSWVASVRISHDLRIPCRQHVELCIHLLGEIPSFHVPRQRWSMVDNMQAYNPMMPPCPPGSVTF